MKDVLQQQAHLFSSNNSNTNDFLQAVTDQSKTKFKPHHLSLGMFGM